jgi:uncharacterized protein YukE
MQHLEGKTAEYSHTYKNRSQRMANLLTKLRSTHRGNRTVDKTAANVMK